MKLNYRYINREGDLIPMNSQMREFAEQYAAAHQKQYGMPPRNQHPFPDVPGKHQFIIEYDPLVSELKRPRTDIDEPADQGFYKRVDQKRVLDLISRLTATP